MKRVIGIGNALTDMLVNLESDSVLGRFKLAKGSMSLVDTKQDDTSQNIGYLNILFQEIEDQSGKA